MKDTVRRLPPLAIPGSDLDARRYVEMNRACSMPTKVFPPPRARFSLRPHINCVVAALPALFLIEAIIAKSRFDGLIGGWRGHMILTVIGIGVLIAVGLWKRARSPLVFGPPRSVTIVLAVACAWAFVCCIAQPNAYANVVFLAVFAANIYACLYIAPNLVLPHLGERAVLVYAIPVFAATLVNLVFGHAASSEAFQQERLAGMSDNATHSGALAALASVVALWMSLNWTRCRRIWFAVWILSIVTLFLTRTRASIFGCGVGSCFLVLLSIRGRRSYTERRWVVGGSLGVALLMAIALLWRPGLLPRMTTHFRIRSKDELLHSRREHWLNGINQAAARPLFGSGPLAKFGDATDVTVNTYEVEKCFCNTWLTFAQAYGIPGSLLFLAVFVCLLYEARSRNGPMPTLAAGLIVLLFGASMGDMWGVSFGNEGDRAIWLLLGLSCALRYTRSTHRADR